MILVDTSIWVHHFRNSEPALVSLLNTGSVACHPFVIGELAAGNLHRRAEILRLLHALPSVSSIADHEYLAFVEKRQLMGKGLGFVDIHLLGASILAGVPLWTQDKRLAQVAGDLSVEYHPR